MPAVRRTVNMKEDEPYYEAIQAAYKALEVAHRINLEK